MGQLIIVEVNAKCAICHEGMNFPGMLLGRVSGDWDQLCLACTLRIVDTSREELHRRVKAREASGWLKKPS